MGDGTIKIEITSSPTSTSRARCAVAGGTTATPSRSCGGPHNRRDPGHVGEEALGFFENQPKIVRILQTIYDVRLGYIRLRPARHHALRRGSAADQAGQRVGPAVDRQHLLHPRRAHRGLHFEDIRELLSVLQRLVDAGNTVVVIEHNLDVVKSADWVIDLGPEVATRAGAWWRWAPPNRSARSPTATPASSSAKCSEAAGGVTQPPPSGSRCGFGNLQNDQAAARRPSLRHLAMPPCLTRCGWSSSAS